MVTNFATSFILDVWQGSEYISLGKKFFHSVITNGFKKLVQ